MKKNLLSAVLAFTFLLSASSNTYSQCTVNYLKNPSFELEAQTTLGNHFPVPAPFWTVTGGAINLVKVDGSNYSGGPNTAAAGTQYLDIVNATATVDQTFTTTCPSTLTFSGDFSSRELGTTWIAKIEIINSANVVVATSSTRTFTTADADQNPPGADAVWYKMSGTSGVLPAGTYTYKSSLDNYANFDNAFVCAEPGCVLPVKLNEFSVLSDNCKPNLQWKTSSEINIKHYEVEESKDGFTFNKVTTIAAQGSLSENVYTFKNDFDNNLKTFYRLKMVDNDGQYKYSDILKFVNNCGKQTSLEVYPNPLVNTMFVNYFDAKNPTGLLKIVNSNGATLKEVVIKNGTSSIDVSAFAKGLYIVTVTGSKVYAPIKIVKR